MIKNEKLKFILRDRTEEEVVLTEDELSGLAQVFNASKKNPDCIQVRDKFYYAVSDHECTACKCNSVNLKAMTAFHNDIDNQLQNSVPLYTGASHMYPYHLAVFLQERKRVKWSEWKKHFSDTKGVLETVGQKILGK